MTGNGITRRTTLMATASNRREHDAEELELLNASFRAQDDVSALNVSEIELRLSSENTQPSGFRTVVLNNQLIVHMITVKAAVPSIVASITVSEDKAISACVGGQLIPASQFQDIVRSTLQTMSQLINLMARVKAWAEAEEPQSYDIDLLLNSAVNCLKSAKETLDEKDDTNEKCRVISFIIEQLRMLSATKYGRHYSPELTVLAYLIHSTSAAAYDVLREQNVLYLPSVSTLKKVTRRLNPNDGLDNSAYLALRASKLNEQERAVTLIIDEIYIAKRVEYSSGQVVGLTTDGDTASTLLCFVAKSLACKYMDMVGIYPMAKLTADKLNECYFDVMQLLISTTKKLRKLATITKT
jgi:hypothetical protein